MVEFSETEKSINISQIEEVEKFVGLRFPFQYKNHLLRFNGGRCNPNIFNFIENGKATNSDIDWFLAIYEGESDNLKEYIEIYKIEEKRLPHHILPIAHDSGGNLICISCGEEDYGKIYFWDHESEVDYSLSDDTDYSNLYFIANSFDEFLANLEEDI